MKNRIKSIFLFLSLLLSFSLMGCGSNHDLAAKKPIKEEKSKLTIAISPTESEEKVDSNDKANTSSVSEQETEKTDAQSESSTSTQKDSNDQSTTNKSNTTTTTSKNNSTTVSAPTTTTSSTNTASTTKKTESPKPATTVTFSIHGPKDRGTILGETKVSFKEGDTIFDILLQSTKKQGIAIESRGSGATAYIEGIDNIYEFDYGTKSGWVFKLNGSNLTKSVGLTQVKDGDRIECYYTE